MFDFLVIALVAWRLGSLLAEEYGPFDIFENLRMWLGVEYDEYGSRLGRNVLSKGIICVWCNSIWFAALGAILISDNILWWALYTLSISAVAIIIDSIVGWLNG